MRRMVVVAAVALLAAACGDGGTYTNPTGGPLPTYPSIEAVTEALSPDCDWQIDLPQDDTDETEGTCEAEHLWVQWIPGDYIMTVDEIRDQAENLSEEHRAELCEHFDGAPFVYGGNWWAIPRDDAQAREVAQATGGYLREALDCHSTAPAAIESIGSRLRKPILDWVVALPGRGAVQDVAATRDGGVVAVGWRERHDRITTWTTGVVARYRADRTLVWRRAWRSGIPYSSARVEGVAVAGSAVYVAGSVYCAGGPGSQGALVVRKYSRTGVQVAQWSTPRKPGWCNRDRPRARGTDIAVTGTGTSRVVAVAGYGYRLGDPEVADGWVKGFTGALRRTWTSRFETARYPGTRDQVTGVAAAAYPNGAALFATGWVATGRSPTPDTDVMLQRIRGDGTIAWTQVVDDYAPSLHDTDRATGVAAGPGVRVSGVVDATAKSPGSGWVSGFGRSGLIRWEQTWGTGSLARGIAMAGAGRAVVTGQRTATDPQSMLLKAYRPTMDQLWQLALDSPESGGLAVTVGDDTIYVGGAAVFPPAGLVFRFVQP
jgi:hypothetical protein